MLVLRQVLLYCAISLLGQWGLGQTGASWQTLRKRQTVEKEDQRAVLSTSAMIHTSASLQMRKYIRTYSDVE